MPGTLRTLGYKPVSNPLGWGGPASAGTMRGTTFAGRNKGYWITRMGGRFGRGGASSASIRCAAFQADKSSFVPGTRIGQTAAMVVDKFMADRVSGGDYEGYVLGGPIPVAANQPVTLSALGTGASWAHGQDNAGTTMHERSGLSSVPATFGSTWSRPEGTMALWAVSYDDVAPTIPVATLSPGSNQSTTDETPTIEFDFRSVNELLPGFAIGQADVLTKYQVQIYNAAKTSKLRDSGRTNATTGMRDDRRVEWTVPTGLPPGTYVARAQVLNAFGTPSAWREWKFTIVGAGSVVLTAPTGVINDDTPDIGWSYTHKQSLAMDAMRLRVLDASGENVVRTEVFLDFATDPVPPINGTIFWSSTGWDELPRGARYNIQAQAVDTDGQPSPWSALQEFRLNAPPYVPINREPKPGTVVTAIPELSAMARDADDPAASTPTEFEVRKVGSGTSITQTGIYNRQINRWLLNLITEGIVSPGDYGEWEWRTRSTDQYGAVGEWSTWLVFEYASAPVVTIVSPSGTIDVANPTFDWTVDRAQTSYRIQLFEPDTGSPIRNGDSGWITSPDTDHTFPSLLLRHLQEVSGRIDVITAGNIPGSVEWEFDVAYTPPPAITGVTVEAVQMPYDLDNAKTGVRAAWDAVVSDPGTPFSGYIVQRRNPITDDIDPLAIIRDINQTEWIDETTPAGGPFIIEVMQEVWNGLDLIPSDPTGVSVSIENLSSVVITPVIGGGKGVSLLYWDGLTITSVQDKSVRSSWSPVPRVSVGPTNYRVINGTAYLHDDEAGTYTETDMAETIYDLSMPFIDDDGAVMPKIVCVRLWDGRRIYGTLMATTEGDWGASNPRAINVIIQYRTMMITITETNFNRGVS